MFEKIKGLDIAFFIFLLTGLGYLVTFLYQWGYNSYFSIPMEFIELSVANISKSISMLLVFFGLGFVYNMFFNKETDISNSVIKIFKPESIKLNFTINLFLQFICLIIFAVLWYLYQKETSTTNILYIWIAFIILYLYGYLKTYKKFCIIAVICFIGLTPFSVGVLNAANKHNYFTINNNNNALIVGYFDKNAIVAKFDASKNILYPSFQLISLDTITKEKNEIKQVVVKELTIEKATTIK